MVTANNQLAAYFFYSKVFFQSVLKITQLYLVDTLYRQQIPIDFLFMIIRDSCLVYAFQSKVLRRLINLRTIYTFFVIFRSTFDFSRAVLNNNKLTLVTW